MTTATLAYSYEELLQRRTEEASVPLTLDIYSWYQEMQKTHRVYYDDVRASWLVFRYDDVHRVLLDTDTFSSQRTTNADGSIDPIASGGIVGMDPPRHRQLRTLISQAFTPRVVAQMEPRIIAAYFHGLIQQRRQEPRADLISEFIQAEVEGEHLPEQDILGTCLLLLIAGHETTTGLISNAIVCLDENPEALRELTAQPHLIPGAIEEVLRYRAVVHTMPRVVAKDTVLLGQEIKAGNLVLPLFAAANLDEAQFPHADRFDIHRTPNRHLGFGYGIHFCLGASLGRLETRIALEAMLERFPNLRMTHSVPLELKPSSFIDGLKHLPITWDR